MFINKSIENECVPHIKISIISWKLTSVFLHIYIPYVMSYVFLSESPIQIFQNVYLKWSSKQCPLTVRTVLDLPETAEKEERFHSKKQKTFFFKGNNCFFLETSYQDVTKFNTKHHCKTTYVSETTQQSSTVHILILEWATKAQSSNAVAALWIGNVNHPVPCSCHRKPW